MNHPSLSLILLATLAAALTSCFQQADESDLLSPDAPTASIRIQTRAAQADASLYPLYAYAFGADNKLLSHQQLLSADDQLQLTIPQQTESRIVILSADPEAYDIPTSPSLTSVITPRVPTTIAGVSPSVASLARGYATSPLQMGFVDVTPQSATATVSVQLHYQVASLSVQLSQLPASCTSAYISVASPAASLTFAGTPVAPSQNTRIPLVPTTDSGSRLFRTSAPVYFFPTSGNTTFSITYNDNEGEQHASATYYGSLQAGTPYQLNGSYSDGSIQLTGTVTPSQWADPVSLDFTFSNAGHTTILNGGNGSTDPTVPTVPDSVITVSAIPEPMTLWNGHLVIAVDDAAATVPASSDAGPKATILLMSLSDWGSLPSALNAQSPTAARDLARTYSEYQLSGWQMPTEAQARLLSATYRNDPDTFDALLQQASADPIVLTDAKGNNLRYLCSDAQKTYSYKTNTITNAGATVTTYHLRLVRTLQLHQQ